MIKKSSLIMRRALCLLLTFSLIFSSLFYTSQTHAFYPLMGLVLRAVMARGGTYALGVGAEWSVAAHIAVLGWYAPDIKTNIENTLDHWKKEAGLTINLEPGGSRLGTDNDPRFDENGKPVQSYDPAEAHGAIDPPGDTFPAIINVLGANAPVVTRWIYHGQHQMIRYYIFNVKQYLGTDATCTTFRSATPPETTDDYAGITSGWAYAWCGYAGDLAGLYGVYSEVFTLSCEQGYQKDSNHVCQKVVPDSEVLKSEDTPCEITRLEDGTIDIDMQNPNCQKYLDEQAVEIIPPRKMRSVALDGVTELTFNDDGTTDIDWWKPEADGGGHTNIHVGPWDNGAGGAPILDITETPGGGSGGPGDGGDDGDGTGTGGGSGDGDGPGTGLGGSCGGPGLPPCTIDDSGFDGKKFDGEIDSALDEAAEQFQKNVDDNSENPHDIGWESFFGDLRFGMPKISCQNPDLSFGADHAWLDLTIDICGNRYIQLFRDMFAWLFYSFTVFYIWRRFMSAEVVTELN